MPSATPLTDDVRIECLRNRIRALENRNKMLESAISTNAPSMWGNQSREVSRLEAKLRQKRKENKTLADKNAQQQALIQWHREDESARISARRCPCCLTDFGETAMPVIIHCGHTICQHCALQLARPLTQRLNQPHHDHLITCPECRQHGIMRPNRLHRNYAVLPGYVRPRPTK